VGICLGDSTYKVTRRMTAEADGTGVPRIRLCELAEVEPRKHRRWLDADLIPEKELYGRLDVIRALSLDELRIRVGPKRMRAVWEQIAQNVAIPSRQLDIIVDLSQDEAWVATTAGELAKRLPRNTRIVVVDVAARAQRALTRFDAYNRRHASGSEVGDQTRNDSASDLGSRRSAPGH
jgi:hypothetical protein